MPNEAERLCWARHCHSFAQPTKLDIVQPTRVHPEAVMGKLRTLEALERDHITRTLEATGWQISGAKGAAAILGMNPNTLRSRML